MGTLAGDLCSRGKIEPRGGTPTAWVHSPVTCAVGAKSKNPQLSPHSMQSPLQEALVLTGLIS